MSCVFCLQDKSASTLPSQMNISDSLLNWLHFWALLQIRFHQNISFILIAQIAYLSPNNKLWFDCTPSARYFTTIFTKLKWCYSKGTDWHASKKVLPRSSICVMWQLWMMIKTDIIRQISYTVTHIWHAQTHVQMHTTLQLSLISSQVVLLCVPAYEVSH